MPKRKFSERDPQTSAPSFGLASDPTPGFFHVAIIVRVCLQPLCFCSSPQEKCLETAGINSPRELVYICVCVFLSSPASGGPQQLNVYRSLASKRCGWKDEGRLVRYEVPTAW
ncbi:hypothetical protein GGTG_00413 [Gaeumannomyces tritici R3-111a-1]|uniref:Uncharacterized protein n=1 Tax=Gaeumannomyces tritici (strain R3-111a-1) TaxID=644352 RepID=J3NGM4_GAET3|nr:hypothetical protein GGTG_00413 [Gaeumannomyces tritici R3-111a-1]EJT80414.1 hypothetical protein GGTG_00413 [Gaeumannomyces tritici R3-111a-1]